MSPDRSPLRAAVIGCGAISHQHLDHLDRSPHADLVAVCDRSPAAARFVAARYHVPEIAEDAAQIFARDDIDVVHILTPPASHSSLVERAVAAGLHVVCEKPLAPTASETERLFALAGSTGVTLVESHNLLFNDETRALDVVLAEGRIGEVKEVDIILALDLTAGPFGDLNLEGPGVDLPGGAVHDYLPHFAYLFLHFASHDEAIVATVAGRLDNLSENPRVGFDHLDALASTSAVRGRLRLASDLGQDEFRVVLRGTAGSAEIDFYSHSVVVNERPTAGIGASLGQLGYATQMVRSAVRNVWSKVADHTPYHGLPRMLDAVYGSIMSGTPSPIAPAQILATARLCDKLVALNTPRR